MLQGKKLPGKAFVLTFAEACGADLEADRRWEQAWDGLAVQAQNRPAAAERARQPPSLAPEVNSEADRFHLRCPQLSGQGSNRILIRKGTGSSAGETEKIHS
jgi:hypothetical protein